MIRYNGHDRAKTEAVTFSVDNEYDRTKIEAVTFSVDNEYDRAKIEAMTPSVDNEHNRAKIKAVRLSVEEESFGWNENGRLQSVDVLDFVTIEKGSECFDIDLSGCVDLREVRAFVL